jgi:two-component system OmpR family sensor kinase
MPSPKRRDARPCAARSSRLFKPDIGLEPGQRGDRAMMRVALLRFGRSRSLSLRLAGIYGLLLAAAVLVVAGVTFAVVRVHLEQALDGQLRNTAVSFQRASVGHEPGLAGLARQTRRWLADRPLPIDQMAAVRLADGRVLTSAGGLDLYEVPRPDRLLDARHSQWLNLVGREGDIRALTVPIRAHGHQLGTLVLLAYQRPVYRTLQALLDSIAVASVAGLALALLLGLVLVRRSLRPLQTMAAEVAAVESDGDLSRRLGLHNEQDEVGQLAHAFDAMLARLAQAFQAQRRFLADASHELRTPITVARAQLELLGDGGGMDQHGGLVLVTEELDRVGRIVDDLLLLARLDEGIPLRREPVEIELVLREAVLRGLLLAPRRIDVEAEPGMCAIADPDRLLQVITNLVTNAITHTDEDGRIAVTGGREHDHAVITVSDDGCGISSHELPRIFERLYRGASERKLRPEGSGLGLAIASSLVRAMDGTIEARSTSEGTTFTIHLPLVAGDDQADPTDAVPPAVKEPAASAASYRLD